MNQKKRVFVFLLLLLCAISMKPMQVKAVPNPYGKSVVKIQKFKVKKKGYIKVTSDRFVSHVLYQGKFEKTKNIQSAYDTTAYFAVSKGTYYLRSSGFYDFKVKGRYKEASKEYRKNTTMESAILLKPGKKKIALSFDGDKKTPGVRYYKFVAKKDARITFSQGVLLDSEGNEVPAFMRKVMKPVYQSGEENQLYHNATSGSLIIGSNDATCGTLEPLKKGETYYLKVEMMRKTYQPKTGKYKDTKTSAALAYFQYSPLGTEVIAF